MNVVSFVEYQPLPRFDGQPWTKVIIKESSDQDGPFNQIDEIVFGDPDVDPSNPKIRSFTTDNAVYEEGWYILTFESANGGQSPTTPIFNTPSLAIGYLPLVSDIGSLLRARTKSTLGVELGTFTTDTRPTFDEVMVMIDIAASDVTAKVDYDLPVETYTQAKDLIALRTAMLVELSYFPEQVAQNKSAYAEYKVLYDDGLERLVEAVTREAAEEIGGESAMLGNMPAFGFPSAEPLWTKVM